MKHDHTIGVKWYRGLVDPRCDQIVVDPTNYLCNKYDIPMGENVIHPKIFLTYRFVHAPKQGTNLHGVLVDDYPPAYYPNYPIFLRNLRTYDFIVTPNPKILEYLRPLIGAKPAFIYSGLTNIDYYRDKGHLQFSDHPNEKRMAFIFQGGYDFPIDSFYHKDWKMLYFHNTDKHTNPAILRHPHTDIANYYRVISNFSPDIIVQGWVDNPFFSFKANLKFRESVILKSCLVAQDLGNIYGIQNGVNGFKWGDVAAFHDLLNNVPLSKFREIGGSHVNTDKQALTDLYTQLVGLYKQLGGR